MIDLPLERLLQIAEGPVVEPWHFETAKKIDPSRPAMAVLDSLQADHPPAAKLLATTQAELDSLGQFMSDHHIVTVPKAATARVQETPPFMRATTFASMDTPGPFEKVATEAYYNVTLPDPAWAAAEQASS
jgi:hypothetical protein